MNANLAADSRTCDSWFTTTAHLAVVCLIAVVTWLPRFGGPIDLRFDAGVYYELGAGLAQGDGYRIVAEPGKPEGIQYPPGLPLLTAAHAWLLGTTDAEIVGTALRRTYFGFTLALGTLSWVLMRRYLTASWATAASAMILLQTYSLMLSNLLFAELPSALCTILFALLLGRRSRQTPTWSTEATLGGLALIGFLLRTANIALLATWVADAFLCRQWKRGIVRALVAILPVVAWQAHVWQVERSSDYLRPAYAYQRAPYQHYNVSYAENMKLIEPFRPEAGKVTPVIVMKRFVRNALRMPATWGGATTVNEGYWYLAIVPFLPNETLALAFATACAAVLGLVAATGLGMLAWRGHRIPALLLGFGTLPVCLTPWVSEFGRYLMPSASIVVLGLMFALRELTLTAEQRFVRHPFLCRGGAVVLLGFLMVVQVVSARSMFAVAGQPPAQKAAAPTWFYYDATWLRWEHALAWIRQRAPVGTIVATTASHMCHLRTGLASVMPPMERDTANLIRLLDSVPVTFVVIDEMEFRDTARRYVQPALIAHSSEWRLVHEEGKTQVYQRIAGIAPDRMAATP